MLTMCALAVLLVSGCSRIAMVPLHDVFANTGHALQGAEGQQITGFITSDGEYHRFRGRVKLEGDSLVFRGRSSENEFREPTHRLGVDDVTTLFSKDFDSGRTMLGSFGVLGVLALLGGLALLVAGLGTGL